MDMLTDRPIEIRTETKPKERKEFPLSIVPIDLLLPHEQIIEAELSRLVEDLKVNGILKYPIVVSEETFVVLDGHHRYNALLRLNYKYAPVILLDYNDDDLIQVDTWYPLIEETLEGFISKFPSHQVIRQGTGSIRDVLGELRQRSFTAIIGNDNGFVCIDGDREEIFSVVRNEYLETIQYADNPQVAFQHAGADRIAVVSWAYTKAEIVEKATKGEVFLPKTTRHSIKYRYSPINLPLSELENPSEAYLLKD